MRVCRLGARAVQRREVEAMCFRPGRETNVRGTAARILCVIALALGLAGCDKCGRFFGFSAPYGLEVCKPDAPKR
jgi:hypothetical protein